MSDSQDNATAEGLTDEEIAAESKFLEDIPRVNIGALIMPGIWGPAHGLWICILFYPLYLFADNVFYGAYSNPTTLSVILALVIFVALFSVQVVFGILSQPYAWHKAADNGKTKEKYLFQQKIWAAVMVVVGIIFIAVATYYNLVIRPGIA